MAATYTVGDAKTYSTIQAAVDAIPDNLSGQGIQTVEVYAKAATNNRYAGANVKTGFTNPGVNDYIILRAMVNHNGLAQASGGSGIFINVPSVTLALYTYTFIYPAQQTRIYGFEIGGYTNASSAVACSGIYCDAGYIYPEKNIIHDIAVGDNAFGLRLITVDATRPANNIIYNIKQTSANVSGVVSCGIYNQRASYIYNNTIYNITSVASSSAGAFGIRNTYAGSIIKNNVCGFMTTVSGVAVDFRYHGTETGANTSNNASSDATADDRGGSNCLINQALTDIDWVSTTAGSENLHIQGTSTLKGAGQDLSAIFTDDIDGVTRVAPWDIGADQYVVSGPTYSGWYYIKPTINGQQFKFFMRTS